MHAAMMNHPVYVHVVETVFSMFFACSVMAALSLFAIFFFKLNDINRTLRHPLLKQRPFKQYPHAIQAGILQDYFFRLLFPRVRRGLFGHANRQLAHVDPNEVPLDVKLPIVGLWAGCWIGLVAMVCLWVLVLYGW
jgi:protein-S-isoprenylcysteine O-methyltransferase Ste14